MSPFYSQIPVITVITWASLVAAKSADSLTSVVDSVNLNETFESVMHPA